jgi:hypothetical protein
MSYGNRVWWCWRVEFGSEKGLQESSCERGNMTSGSIKCSELFDELSVVERGPWTCWSWSGYSWKKLTRRKWRRSCPRHVRRDRRRQSINRARHGSDPHVTLRNVEISVRSEIVQSFRQHQHQLDLNVGFIRKCMVYSFVEFYLCLYSSLLGRAIAQAVSCWLLAAAARVQTRV